jgi:hypothetical protein
MNTLYRTLITISLFSFCLPAANGQAIYRWANVMPGYSTISQIDQNQANAVVINRKKEVYVAGTFGNEMDLNAQAGVDSISGNGSYLAKYDSTGQFMWGHNLGGVTINAACSDHHGNYYLSGFYNSASDSLGLGIVAYALAAPSNNTILIAKYDSTDHLQWVANNTSGGSAVIVSMTADDNGNVYVSGQLNGTVIFQPGNLSYTTSATDGFVAKYDNTGTMLWKRVIHGYDGDNGTGVCLDASNNVIVTGITGGLLYNYVPFETANSQYDTITTNGAFQYDAFVVKYDNDGNYLWAKAIGSPGNDQAYAVVTDKASNIYTGGYFTGQMNVDPALNAGLNTSGYLVKLSSNGNYIWGKIYGQDTGSQGISSVMALATDDSNRIYVSGYYKGTITLDPANPNIHSTPTWYNWTDGYVLRLDSAGHFKWDERFYGMGATEPGFVTVDDSFNVYTSGSISDTTYFNGSNPNGRVNYHSPNPNWSPSSFFVKYAQPVKRPGANVVSIAENTGLAVYPNPAESELTVTNNNGMPHAVVNIYDMAGRVCPAQKLYGANSVTINTATLAPGNYLLQYGDDNTARQLVKFSKW